MANKLRREVEKARATRARIENLIIEARTKKPPTPYAELEEITGWTREFIRRIANGERSAGRTRQMPPKD